MDLHSQERTRYSELQGRVSGGEAVPIVSFDKEGKLFLDEEKLDKILSQDDVKDCNAMVIVVAGIFRMGKSFLLNFILRYLYFMEKDSNHSRSNSWLGSEYESLPLGFKWKNSNDLVTEGIQIWSKVFFTTVDKEKVAIILADTQGTFDNRTRSQDCAKLFALGTLFSSVFIYNVPKKIGEDSLQNLAVFTGFSKNASQNFQKLIFLVRDYSSPHEYSYGSKGGKLYLEHIFENDSAPPENILLRSELKSTFSKMKCFLMPHPGLVVESSNKFDGQISEIDKKFVQHLDKFIPRLFSPKNIVQKEILGRKVKVKELIEYFKEYYNTLTEELAPDSVYTANVKASNLVAIEAATNIYEELMKKGCQDTYMKKEEFDKIHELSYTKAVAYFERYPKYGGNSSLEPFRQKFRQKCWEMKDNFHEINQQLLPWFKKKIHYVGGFLGGATISGSALGTGLVAAETVIGVATVACLGVAVGVLSVVVVAGFVAAKYRQKQNKRFTWFQSFVETFEEELPNDKKNIAHVVSKNTVCLVTKTVDWFKSSYSEKCSEEKKRKHEEAISDVEYDNVCVSSVVEEFRWSNFRDVYKLLF